MNPVLGGAIAVVSAVAICGVLVWAYLRARRWREMVLAIGQRYRLKVIAPPGIFAMGTASAFGEIEGIDVDLKVDEETRGTGDRSTTTRFLNLSASGNVDTRLVLHDRKRKTPTEQAGYVDFAEDAEDGPAAETPIGEPAFDQRLMVRRASPGLREAIRSGDLGRRVLELAAWGLIIEGGNVTLRTRRFPRTADEMSGLVDNVVALTRELAKHQRG